MLARSSARLPVRSIRSWCAHRYRVLLAWSWGHGRRLVRHGAGAPGAGVAACPYPAHPIPHNPMPTASHHSSPLLSASKCWDPLALWGKQYFYSAVKSSSEISSTSRSEVVAITMSRQYAWLQDAGRSTASAGLTQKCTACTDSIQGILHLANVCQSGATGAGWRSRRCSGGGSTGRCRGGHGWGAVHRERGDPEP
ncbi:hypothetical protein HaLaN_30148, partial [Haematococcus lacustris]